MQARVERHRFTLPLKGDDELHDYCRLAFGINVPRTRICPNHVSPFDALAAAYFAREPVAVWKASRGFGGKSQLLALLSLVEFTTLGADVNLLGGSGEQAARVLAHMSAMWRHPAAPRRLMRGEVAREQRGARGNYVRALMASTASVRGPHPQRLRLDEIDEMDVEILDAAMGQPMTRGGIPTQVVMSSTHHYAEGTMTEILRRAGMRAWPIREWCYRETLQPHGWLTPGDVEDARGRLTEAMFRAEIELQEPAAGNRLIDPAAVDRMFDPALGVFEDPREGQMVRALPGEELPGGAACTTGADWARKEDCTEIVTLRHDTTPAILVAYTWMTNLPWPIMVGKFEEQVQEYSAWNDGRHVAAIHDGIGVGDVVAGYVRIKAHAETAQAGQARQALYNTLVNAIERDLIRAPVIPRLKAQLKYATINDIYGNGHVPDGLAALALAWKGANMRQATWTTG